jgi:hypothetical protein
MWLMPLWALITATTDGFSWMLGPVRLSSTDPLRPLLVGLAATILYVWRYPREPIAADADGAWLAIWFGRFVKLAVPVIVALGCVIGIVYGTFTAAGSDQYGYVSQAGLWLRGNLRIEQPIVQQVSWSNASWTFTPLGYRPVSAEGTLIPTYSSGLPLLMAAFQAAFGFDGAFFVVPILGSLALACTYMLGKLATGSRNAGALAALLLLASPAFLAHVILPMSDVPAAAFWALACVLALWTPTPRPLLSGLAAGASLLIRPNLVLLAAVPVVSWVFAARRPGGWLVTAKRIAAFGIGLAPAVVAVALINLELYGSPTESGYGKLTDIYGFAAAGPNLRNYGTWLLETQSPLLAVALIPLFVPGSLRPATAHASPRACLLALPATVALSYIFYGPWDNWTYLRFLLPAYPALFVLMAAGVRVICNSLPLPARVPAGVLFAAACVSINVQFANKEVVFRWHDTERRYIRAADRAAELSPPNAVMFSLQHSGTLRHYADRLSLRYDQLPEDYLDKAIRELNAMGRPSYLVIDDWEYSRFRARFAAGNRAGTLGWEPLARIPGPPEVLIFDLNGRSE